MQVQAKDRAVGSVINLDIRAVVDSAESIRRYLQWKELSGKYPDDVVKPLIEYATGQPVDMQKAREKPLDEGLIQLKYDLMSKNLSFSLSNKVTRNARTLLASIISPAQNANQIFNALKNVRRFFYPDLHKPFDLPASTIRRDGGIDEDALLAYMDGKFCLETGAVTSAYQMALINIVLKNTNQPLVTPFKLKSRLRDFQNIRINQKTLAAIENHESLTSSQRADLRAKPAAYAYKIVIDANTENLPGVIKAINYMQEITSRAVLKALHAV